jgi:hypothetical protein
MVSSSRGAGEFSPAGGNGGVPQILSNPPRLGDNRGLISFNQGFFE